MPLVNTNVQVFVQALFRKHERTGRPLWVDSFISRNSFWAESLNLKNLDLKRKIRKVSPEYARPLKSDV